jgi:hypothetical protein
MAATRTRSHFFIFWWPYFFLFGIRTLLGRETLRLAFFLAGKLFSTGELSSSSSVLEEGRKKLLCYKKRRQ